jgi:hypothetical protein
MLASQLMSRFIIGANQAIFASLDSFCAARGVRLANASKPRWITSKKTHVHFMSASIVRDVVNFSASRKLARLDLGEHVFFCMIGFDQPELLPKAIEVELDAAFLTVILADIQPRPRANISEIRNIVEASDREVDASYNGHDPDHIASLFPGIRIFSIPQEKDISTWNVFFRICIEECDYGASWIGGDLAAALRTVCDLDPEQIPYRVLCRSVFDGDPSSFFLALYRCLEALYSYSSAQAIVTSLGLNREWGAVAAVLEDTLGWHPREEGSLVKLLSMSALSDLRHALYALGDETEGLDGPALVTHAAKKIYWLRNSIVHYRPAQHSVPLDEFDWEKLCTAMTGIIMHVYVSVFHGGP